MKQKLKPLALSLCLMGIVNVPAFADTSNAALQQEVNQLEGEVAALKQQMHSNNPAAYTRKGKRKGNVSSNGTPIPTAKPAVVETTASAPQISGPSNLPGINSIRYLPVDLDVPGQSFVSSGPYLGVPLEYAGGDLIVNDPSVNQDVSLLKLRKNIDNRLTALGMTPEQYRSHILLSGFIEGQAAYMSQGANNSTSDIDVTATDLDVYILSPSPWVSGLAEFSYDNNLGTNEGSLFYNTRSANSRVFVNKAFITIGDFNQSPFYGSVGQMYVPFGVYSSVLVSSTLPKILGRVQDRAILLGYQQQQDNALYGAIYGFKGDSHGASVNKINNGGINLGYRLKQTLFSEDIGAGVIGNIADSQGMQINGNQPPQFAGFGGNQLGCVSSSPNALTPALCGNERLVHRVPAYDVHAKFGIGDNWDFLAEYITASTQFNPNDMQQNGRGAKPQALDVEASYSFQAFAHPTSLGVGYGMSKQALALGLAPQRYSLVVNTSFWRNTLESLEFRHDTSYARSMTASGSGITTMIPGAPADNAVTAQMDLYF